MRLARRRAGRGPAPDVPDDERGADRRGRRGSGPGLSRPPAARSTMRASDCRAARPAQRSGPPVRHHRAPRRAPACCCTQKAYVEGALALCLYCARLVDDGRALPEDGRGACCGLLTPVAKTLAVRIRPGGQRHRDPDPRRLWLHARDFDVEQLWPRQPAQPHPRGHRPASRAWTWSGARSCRDGGGPAAAGPGDLAHGQGRRGGPRAGGTRPRPVGGLAVGDRHDRGPARRRAACGPGQRHRAPLGVQGHVVGGLAAGWTRRWPPPTCRTGDLADGKLRACRFFFECEPPRIDPWRLSPVAAPERRGVRGRRRGFSSFLWSSSRKRLAEAVRDPGEPGRRCAAVSGSRTSGRALSGMTTGGEVALQIKFARAIRPRCTALPRGVRLKVLRSTATRPKRARRSPTSIRNCPAATSRDSHAPRCPRPGIGARRPGPGR